MARAIVPGYSRETPNDTPDVTVTRQDMARVTDEDWRVMRAHARGYCRKVDATRSRRRMDGSATITRDGHGTYGSDEASEDVTQDAVLLFAHRFAEIISSCPVASLSVHTRQPDSWQYTTRKGESMIVTRGIVRYWAVQGAAARNGYRPDRPPSKIDATPGAQLMRAIARAEHLATTTFLAAHSQIIFEMAWRGGTDFPFLARMLPRAEAADDLGRAGILSHTAQDIHGGKLGSRHNVIRTRHAALAEWRALSERLDEARHTLAYRGARTTPTLY
jgi:galactarate dehydratase